MVTLVCLIGIPVWLKFVATSWRQVCVTPARFLAPFVPYVFLAGVVWITYEFDVIYFAIQIGTCTPNTDGGANQFIWLSPSLDPIASAREATARLVLQSICFILWLGIGIAVCWCACRIFNVFKFWPTGGLWWGVLCWQYGVMLFLMGGGMALWIWHWWEAPGQPFESSLWRALMEKVAGLTNRQGILDNRMWIQTVMVRLVLPLLATTAGFVVAQAMPHVTTPRAAVTQLRDLTVILYLTAGIQVLYAFMQGAMLLWVASLLPHESDGQASVVRQYAFALSLNFGVQGTIMAASFHLPSAWLVAWLRPADSKQADSPIGCYVKVWPIAIPLFGAVLTKGVGVMFA